MDEIPENDLEGQKIKVLRSVGDLTLKRGQIVDEAFISQIRYKHKLSFYQY